MLLLLNSLFSYLIVKFADYFGLQKPCLWCSRLDHILEPGKYSNSYRDLVCEAHASEISKLGYCLNHRKLAESRDMCEDCSSSSQPDSPELSKRFAFFPWMNKIGLIQSGDEKVSENGEGNLSCSCCGVLLDSKFYSPCILIKPSWGDSDYTQKQNLIEETGVDAQIDEGDYSDRSRSDFAINLCEDAQSIEENRGIQIVSDDVVDDGSGRKEEETEETCSVCDFGCKELVADEDGNLNMVIEKKREPVKEENLNVSTVHANCSTDTCLEILPQHLEFYIDHQDCRLIPVGLIGSAAVEEQGQPRYNVEDQGNCDNQDVILDFDMHVEEQAEPVVENWHNLGEKVALRSKDEVELLESLVLVESDSISVLHTEEKDLVREEYEQVSITEATQTTSRDDDQEDQAAAAATAREMYSDVHLGSPICFISFDFYFYAIFGVSINSSNDFPLHAAPEEAIQMQGNEFEVDISRGTEIPDQEPLDESQTQEFLPSYEHRQEDPSTSTVIQQVDDNGKLLVYCVTNFRNWTLMFWHMLIWYSYVRF